MSSALANLPGLEDHPHARAVLGGALAGEPSHAYLFHGPTAVQRAVALSFAAQLLAGEADDLATVRSRAERGSHPDLTWVTPSGAHEMLRADIDEPVVAAAVLTPFEADRRVFVIERVETMNDEAANRLLKTLEEPPSYVHIVMLCERPDDVLATIRSRCQLVRFESPSDQELAAKLAQEGVPTGRALACARLASGDLELAQYLASEDGEAQRAAAIAFARAPYVGSLAERLWLELLERAKARGEQAASVVEEELAEQLEYVSKKDRKRTETEAAERSKRAKRRAETTALDRSLRLVEYWYRDLVCLKHDTADLVLNCDLVAELQADAEQLGTHALRAAIEQVEDTRTRLELNVGAELALEALAYLLQTSFTN